MSINVPNSHSANILPRDIAERLELRQNKIIADRFENASVLFLDLAGSTALASHLSPEALVTFLNMIFTRLDDMVDRFGLEKIKTTGDGYMVVSGVPNLNPRHAEVIADFALAIQREFRNLTDPDGEPIPFRSELSRAQSSPASSAHENSSTTFGETR